jgi:hypothetical protein
MRLSVIALFCLAASVGLSACSSSEDKSKIDELQHRVEQLEKENSSLRTKLPNALALSLLTSAVNDAQTKNIQESAATEAEAPKPQTTNHPKFSDLDEVAQKQMIEDLAKIGIFDGASNEFLPNKNISRGEYVTWLYKAYNAIMPAAQQIHLATSAPPFFKDLSASDPAYKYAQALANAGYSVGYEDGTFKSNQPITREEMISMKVGVDCGKALEPWRSQLESVWKFSDSKNIAERYTGYIHQDFYVSGSYGSNIQRAFGKIGTFHAKAPVTRAEAAGTLWQIGQFGAQGHTANLAIKS